MRSPGLPKTQLSIPGLIEREQNYAYHHRRCVHFRETLEHWCLPLEQVRGAPPDPDLGRPHRDPVASLQALTPLSTLVTSASPSFPPATKSPLESWERQCLGLGGVNSFDHVQVDLRRVFGDKMKHTFTGGAERIGMPVADVACLDLHNGHPLRGTSARKHTSGDGPESIKVVRVAYCRYGVS